jgi:hypothetical protein
MKNLLVVVLSLMLSFASTSTAADVVKKSTNGICHDKKSQYYSKTKNFKPFKNMKECLDSGGRLPKR